MNGDDLLFRLGPCLTAGPSVGFAPARLVPRSGPIPRFRGSRPVWSPLEQG